MKVLLTGASGQVGQAVVNRFAYTPFDLVALSRNELNITSEKSIEEIFIHYQPDLLINAAAFTVVDVAEDRPDLAFLINESAVRYLGRICSKWQIPLIHLSTDYVFDGTKSGPYDEEDEVNPGGVYGKSKLAGENALRNELSKHVILRTSWVFSETGTNFVKTIVRLASERDELRVVDDQIGGATSACSIADVIFRIVQLIGLSNKFSWGTYHFCQQPYVSWYEFAKKIIDLASDVGTISGSVNVKPVSTIEFGGRVRRPQNSCLSIKKLSGLVDLSKTSWEADVAIVLDHLSRGNHGR